MVAGVCLPVWKGQGSGLLFRGMLIRLLVVTRSPARKEGFMLAYSLMENSSWWAAGARDCCIGHINHNQGTVNRKSGPAIKP